MKKSQEKKSLIFADTKCMKEIKLIVYATQIGLISEKNNKIKYNIVNIVNIVIQYMITVEHLVTCTSY